MQEELNFIFTCSCGTALRIKDEESIEVRCPTCKKEVTIHSQNCEKID